MTRTPPTLGQGSRTSAPQPDALLDQPVDRPPGVVAGPRDVAARTRADRSDPAPGPVGGDGPVGVGHAPCHHGEILQGIFLDSAGRPCRGLVTLPVPGTGTTATFVRHLESPAGHLTVRPADREKARRAAALAVAECARRTGEQPCGGRLALHGRVPVGIGMGSSTSDVIATARAVAASFGVRLPPETVARIAVRAEQASDPLMLGTNAALFASREARVLEDFGGPLPSVVVLSCTTGAGRPVDTLALPAPSVRAVPAYEELRAALRQAIVTADVGLLARVSSESARRNQPLLPKPELDVLERVAGRAGATGVQVAHSGNVAGLLFDPAAPDLPDRLRRAAGGLAAHGLRVGRSFGI
ncbi:hypothetical protein [Micromonospora inyonensis]|uniref:Protein involved in propanediol utilization n=1 Tax=Micromonospora inyonensis TaxID=47866 RepID=A0A1C6SAY7_9ACTN|nr:hypothetical protein [Micromonospora inyonensis]SCL26501.1 Protein involved in propanediol utilization [Micromonospora inyonensis]